MSEKIIQKYSFNSEAGILRGISNGLELKINTRHRGTRGKPRLYLTTNEGENSSYVSGLFATQKPNSYSLGDKEGNFFILNVLSENEAEIISEAPALTFKKIGR